MEILENGIYIYIFYSISFKIYKYLLLSILDNFIFFTDGGELPRRMRRILRRGEDENMEEDKDNKEEKYERWKKKND